MNENNTSSNVENQVQAIHDYDVLLGRGKLYDKHLGNQNFQGRCTIYIYICTYAYIYITMLRLPMQKFIHLTFVFRLYHNRSRHCKRGTIFPGGISRGKVWYLQWYCLFDPWFSGRKILEAGTSLLDFHRTKWRKKEGSTGVAISTTQTKERGE